MTDLQDMLDKQRELQLRLYGQSPAFFVGEQRADYVRTMMVALEDELAEVRGEVSWKPWAKSDFLNREAYVSELVDAWHFFMNLMLVAGITADEFIAAYETKLAKNHKRQDDGYDGVSSKCRGCKRDLDDAGVDCWSDAYNNPAMRPSPTRAWCVVREQYV